MFAANSPPTDKPEIRRPSTRMTGAQIPAAAKLDVSPTINEPSPIAAIVNTRVRFRPIRSARLPTSNPPIGRSRKLAANTAKAESSAAVGSPASKICGAKTTARKL